MVVVVVIEVSTEFQSSFNLIFFLKLKVFNQARYQIKRSENPVRFHYIPVDKILFLDQTLPAIYM